MCRDRAREFGPKSCSSMDSRHFLQAATSDASAALDERSLFHAGWYAEKYLTANDVDSAWNHYCSTGESDGNQPHPLFIPAFYRASSGEHHGLALRHFAEVGLQRGLSPHPLLRSVSPETGLRWHEVNDDPEIAHLLTPVVGASEGSSLLRYLLASPEDWRYPNAAFDRVWYRENYHLECEKFGDPLTHYLAVGGFDGRPTGLGLEWRPYVRRDPSILRGVVTPLEHYLLSGSVGMNYFGKVRPEVQIMDALRSGDTNRSRSLLASFHHTQIEAWSIIELTDLPLSGPLTLRILGSAILAYRDGVGHLHGEPGAVSEADNWVRSGDFVALRMFARQEHRHQTNCLVLGEHEVFDVPKVQAIVSQALWRDIPVAVTPNLERAIRVLARDTGVTLRTVPSGDEVEVCVVRLEPDRGTSTPPARRSDIVLSAATNQGSSCSDCSIPAVGLALILALLPSSSSILCTDARNYSPLARRELLNLAASRGIKLRMRSKGAH